MSGDANAPLPEGAASVIEWWYGPLEERLKPGYQHRYQLWFGRGADDEIKQRFDMIEVNLGCRAVQVVCDPARHARILCFSTSSTAISIEGRIKCLRTMESVLKKLAGLWQRRDIWMAASPRRSSRTYSFA